MRPRARPARPGDSGGVYGGWGEHSGNIERLRRAAGGGELAWPILYLHKVKNFTFVLRSRRRSWTRTRESARWVGWVGWVAYPLGRQIRVAYPVANIWIILLYSNISAKGHLWVGYPFLDFLRFLRLLRFLRFLLFSCFSYFFSFFYLGQKTLAGEPPGIWRPSPDLETLSRAGDPLQSLPVHYIVIYMQRDICGEGLQIPDLGYPPEGISGIPPEVGIPGVPSENVGILGGTPEHLLLGGSVQLLIER